MLKVMLIFYGVRIRLLLVYALSSILELLQTCKFCHLFLLYTFILCCAHWCTHYCTKDHGGGTTDLYLVSIKSKIQGKFRN